MQYESRSTDFKEKTYKFPEKAYGNHRGKNYSVKNGYL
jgi:hypothetical protein